MAMNIIFIVAPFYTGLDVSEELPLAVILSCICQFLFIVGSCILTSSFINNKKCRCCCPVCCIRQQQQQTGPKTNTAVYFGLGQLPATQSYSDILNQMLLELCSNRNAQEKKDLFRKLATDKDVNVNCRNNIGRTPLMLLCSKNFIDFDILASILLKPYDNFSHSRVDLKLKDREGSNALHLLLDSNHNFIDETLITNLLCHPSSLDLNDRNKDGMNTLHLLCASSYKDQNLSKLIQLLIEKGLKINETDKNGFSALDHILSSNRNDNIKKEITHLLSNYDQKRQNELVEY